MYRLPTLILFVFFGVFASFANADFDRTNPNHLAALKAEVTNDPLLIGYSAVGGSTQALLDLLNAKNYTVAKPKISAASIRSETTYDAYNNLSIDEQEWLRWITGSGGFETEDILVTDDVRERLAGEGGQSIWATSNRSAMEAAMLALMDVPGSRAEVLFGFDTVITREDWIAARDSQ